MGVNIDIRVFVGLDDLRQFKVPRDDGHLKGRLAVVIADIFVGATKKQDTSTALLVVESTDVQGRVP